MGGGAKVEFPVSEISPERARQLDKIAANMISLLPPDIAEAGYVIECLDRIRCRWIENEQAGAAKSRYPLAPHLRVVEF